MIANMVCNGREMKWLVHTEEGMFLVSSSRVKLVSSSGSPARKSHGKHHEISWQGARFEIPCRERAKSHGCTISKLEVGEISLISYHS